MVVVFHCEIPPNCSGNTILFLVKNALKRVSCAFAFRQFDEGSFFAIWKSISPMAQKAIDSFSVVIYLVMIC